jgi:hypothetical protein
MSKTNDTSKLGHAALEDHRALGDTELDAVTGGTTASVGALGYTIFIPMGVPVPPSMKPPK